MRDHVVACTLAGAQAGFHVIGDAGADTVVAGMQAAADVVGLDRFRRARHRLEHLEMVDAEGIATLVGLGVVASVQPAFDAAWGGTDGMYAARLGAERAMTLNPFAEMAAAGLSMALGSDSPVTPVAPWEAVRACVNHRNPRQRISARSAFLAHTRGGWRAAGIDDRGYLDLGSRPASRSGRSATWSSRPPTTGSRPGAPTPGRARRACPTCRRVPPCRPRCGPSSAVAPSSSGTARSSDLPAATGRRRSRPGSRATAASRRRASD